jgi:hypothetical protein
MKKIIDMVGSRCAKCSNLLKRLSHEINIIKMHKWRIACVLKSVNEDGGTQRLVLCEGVKLSAARGE